MEENTRAHKTSRCKDLSYAKWHAYLVEVWVRDGWNVLEGELLMACTHKEMCNLNFPHLTEESKLKPQYRSLAFGKNL